MPTSEDVEVAQTSSEPWAPGTVQIEALEGSREHIMLQPQPSTDPNDPLNWSKIRKIINYSLVCFYAFMSFVLLDIGTVIWSTLNEDLGISYDDLNNSFAANTAGLALGGVIFIPFALKYGRRPVYIVSTAVLLATAIWQAKFNTTAELILINVLNGLAGATSETMVQITVADLFFVHQRGTMNGIYLMMVSAGTFLAPVAAGYSAVSQGWRWIWWWCAIFLAVSLLGFILFFEETKYIPIMASQSVSLPEGTMANVSADDKTSKAYTSHSVLHTIDNRIPMKSYGQRLSITTSSPGSFMKFFRHTYQPFIILFSFPAVVYTAIIYGSLLAWFSVILTTLSTYFAAPPYNFSAFGIGLLNLPPFIGSIFGALVGGPINDWLILKLARRNGGIFEPEMRLYLALPSILILPASVFMYGYSMANGNHWIVPCVGTALFGFSFNALGDMNLTYLTDCYKEVVGDSLVAVAFVRNAFATVIVCALTSWINGLGLHNMFTSAGCIALLLSLTTLPMIIWGKKARIITAQTYKKMAARQFNPREL
ncbi:MFS general substrate transporter [Lepidopterella palustris CBS 459.81]|uniref:MFS general substrate transporter n=1 Tax=Lepidopterella palustris CBS 459.81 TaxID=1314670 RepID=A0A8E2E5V4_9PEZI|nr:MFS general substrate transporter [Lepidopterella palustris CBS 459.81]